MSARKTLVEKPLKFIAEFIQLESFAGVLLFSAAVIALILDNSAARHYYTAFVQMDLGIRLGAWQFSKPLMHWVNDGLMTIFFFLVGLEIKRELLEGELNSLAKVSLPSIAAVGGMAIPALCYVALNYHHETHLRGWAIPAATDIAFALGILSLVGKRVPTSLKIFLMALAIFDDVGAIIIIGLFYTSTLHYLMLALAGLVFLALLLLNYYRCVRLAPYLLLGFLLWLLVLKSGIHATVAGVLLALTIPLRDPNNKEHSPLRYLEHRLHPWVAFLIMPLFGFVNAGVSFQGMAAHVLFNSVTLGIIAGLFLGKQIGIFGATWLAVKLGLGAKPDKASWLQIYGVSLVCGVGFTMSLFIGNLAFSEYSATYTTTVRLGVLAGSLISGLMGYLLLRCAPPQQTKS